MADKQAFCPNCGAPLNAVDIKNQVCPRCRADLDHVITDPNRRPKQNPDPRVAFKSDTRRRKPL